MKKTIIISTILAATAFAVTSCNLDLRPAGTLEPANAFQTLSDAEHLRAGNYIAFRGRVSGTVTYTPDLALLRRDAAYLARTRCGANLAMLHAIFGQPITEMDEKSYIDLLGDKYVVARYLRLRRYTPYPQPVIPASSADTLCGGGHYELIVANPTDQPQTLTLTSDYAILAAWEDITHE